MILSIFCPFLRLDYLVDLSLQENGGRMKYLNSASDHLREKTDIGLGQRMFFVV